MLVGEILNWKIMSLYYFELEIDDSIGVSGEVKKNTIFYFVFKIEVELN